MHSRIYQLSQNQNARPYSYGDLPEWFFDNIADYADDIDIRKLDEEMQSFVHYEPANYSKEKRLLFLDYEKIIKNGQDPFGDYIWYDGILSTIHEFAQLHQTYDEGIWYAIAVFDYHY